MKQLLHYLQIDMIRAMEYLADRTTDGLLDTLSFWSVVVVVVVVVTPFSGLSRKPRSMPFGYVIGLYKGL